ncbi:MAG: four helix bundle protein [Candidatus Andersenbacteria bacterium]|nr:four helix bundle protein [Candidatus Andersenbacteria bacterium]
MRRYSLGVKIDQLFTELIALVTETQFSQPTERGPLLKRAVTCNDILKNMFYVLLELKGIEEDQFVIIAPMLEEIGRILYGWKNQKPKKS